MAERWQQWMPHDIDSWQGSANIQALSDLAYRAVHNLLQDMWKQPDCSLPIEDRELAKRSRVTSRWAECRDEVMEYFTDRTADGRITHRVLRKKFEEARAVYDKRRQAAAKTNAKAPQEDGDRNGDCDGDRSGDRTQDEGIASRSADTHTQTQTQTETSTGTEKPKQARAGRVFEIPSWIDRAAWERFEEMRRKNRKPLADGARKLLVAKLETLRRGGHDPTAVLDQSTLNGWQGVFELKDGPRPQPGYVREPQPEMTEAEAREVRERIDRKRMEIQTGGAYANQ